MRHDHRRILATAMGRLRAKMKYRPVIFEMMPQAFTLTALQHTAEAISGRRLHKQNFRRFVENSAVVEPTPPKPMLMTSFLPPFVAAVRQFVPACASAEA